MIFFRKTHTRTGYLNNYLRQHLINSRNVNVFVNVFKPALILRVRPHIALASYSKADAVQ